MVDSPQRNPKGLQESSRWSKSAETTGKVLVMTAPRRGARRHNRYFSSNSIPAALRSSLSSTTKECFIEGSSTPPGCDLLIIAFPVVSADSDHRLLSLQPFGLLR